MHQETRCKNRTEKSSKTYTKLVHHTNKNASRNLPSWICRDVKQRYTIANGKIHQETRYKKQNCKKAKQNSKTYTNLFITRTTMSQGIERLRLSPGTANGIQAPMATKRTPKKITKKVDNKNTTKKSKTKNETGKT